MLRALFCPPTHYIHTGWLCGDGGSTSGLIGMLTYSQTAPTTAGSARERPAVGLNMKPDGRKKERTPWSAGALLGLGVQ